MEINRFLESTNTILKDNNCDWYLVSSPAPGSLHIYNGDSDYVDHVPKLRTAEETAAMILHIERISNKFHKRGFELGKRRLQIQLCNILGASLKPEPEEPDHG